MQCKKNDRFFRIINYIHCVLLKFFSNFNVCVRFSRYTVTFRYIEHYQVQVIHSRVTSAYCYGVVDLSAIFYSTSVWNKTYAHALIKLCETILFCSNSVSFP
jgi:hypothetical protein